MPKIRRLETRTRMTEGVLTFVNWESVLVKRVLILVQLVSTLVREGVLILVEWVSTLVR